MAFIDREEAKRKFIESFKKDGNVTIACQFANISRDTAYQWRKLDKDFEKDWDDSLNASNDVVRKAIFGRAVDGWDEPLVSAGKLVRDEKGVPMTVKKYSDPLLQFLAKSRMPEFREKQSVDVTGSIKIKTEWGNSAVENDDGSK